MVVSVPLEDEQFGIEPGGTWSWNGGRSITACMEQRQDMLQTDSDVAEFNQ